MFEYESTDAAIASVTGLNGISLGEFRLSLQRVPQAMVSMLLQPVVSKAPEAKNPLVEMPPTAALQLCNMVAAEDLRDDELYLELMEDVADECNSHGTVRSIAIPRPMDSATNTGDYSVSDKSEGLLHWNCYLVIFRLS